MTQAAAIKTNSESSSRASRIFSSILGYGVLAITLGMLLFFLIIPVGVIMVKAFYDGETFTLRYFELLFQNQLQTAAILNSLWVGFYTVIFTTLLTIPLAIITVKFNFFGKSLLSGLLLVPLVMPPFVGAIGFQRFFGKFGSVNLWLMEWGWIDSPIEWLGDSNLLWAVVILEVLHLYPIMYLNLTAALANVDPSMEEMAHLTGAGRFRTFKDIVWPLARPGYFAGVIIVFIWAFTDLGTPLLVGYHETIPVRIFNMVTDINENPVGFALVFIVVILTVSIFLISKTMFSGNKYQMLAKGHVTDTSIKAGPLLTLFFYGVLGTTVLLALIPHISVFITSISHNWFMTPLPEEFTLQYYGLIFEQELSVIGIKNSFLLSGLSTLLDLVLGILIAYVITRKLIPMSNLLD
ncbi:MAG: iron ABC transporter permease, partial [Oligoflexales bacterium]|nr:iron ABC transporter permease [Oligoflexales bacterium]